ncbi:MAG: hypothetical protein ACON47_06210 [Flavobacteriaceae bacterium]
MGYSLHVTRTTWSFLVNQDMLAGIERAGMAIIIDFFYHEGYHLFPQEKFKEPYAAHSDLRFKIPDDYPHDVESFALIMAGIKLTELVYQEQDQEKLETYLKMQHTIFKQLIDNDQSGKNYVKGYYLFYCWLGGAPTFMGNDLVRNESFYSKDKDNYYKSLELLTSEMKNAIDNNIKTINVNGQDIVSRYPAIVNNSFYTLGFLPYLTLEKLGMPNVFSLTAQGHGPVELIDNYITTQGLTYDTSEILQQIKQDLPDFDWESNEALARSYIELWE